MARAPTVDLEGTYPAEDDARSETDAEFQKRVDEELNGLPLGGTTVPTDITEEGATYVEYTMKSYYTEETGWKQLAPATADGAEAVFVKAHATVGQRVLIWQVARRLIMPEPPDPAPDPTKEVLLSTEICGLVPVFMADCRNVVYVLWGKYTYGLKTPAREFPLGVGVESKKSPSAHVVKKFSKGRF